ncbi:MAG: PEP-CTERM sorting domain-containing protein [Candidatus Eisenbacteria bacterium]
MRSTRNGRGGEFVLSALALGLVLTLAAAAPVQAADGICCLEPSGQPTPPVEGPAAPAGTVVLDFEGLANLEAVNSYYDGGLGGGGSGPGPDFDVTFTTNSLAVIDADAGGTGNFGGEPSPDTILFFLTGAAATMNVPSGFTTGFSFYYSAINNPAQIVVYDGLNATGNILATLPLPLTPFNGAPDPTGQFSPLVPIGIAFSGTALSVDFGGTVNQVGFDDITLGSDVPGGGSPSVLEIPTLSRTAVIGFVLLLMGAGAFLLLRRRAH